MTGLSIVIPARNEARRLPPYLREIVAYSRRSSLDLEIVVVDDGSSDGMGQVLQQAAGDFPLRVVTHAQTRGKGAAVASGVRAARGDRVLVTDADGATPIDQQARLRAALDRGADVAIGSRRIGRASREIARPWRRRLASAAFHRAVRWQFALPFADTQCGFKMFRRAAAERLFGLVEEPGYLMDLELLWWAVRLGFSVREIPVQWTERPGGQFRLIPDGLAMLAALPRLRRKLERRRWDVAVPSVPSVGGPHWRSPESLQRRS